MSNERDPSLELRGRRPRAEQWALERAAALRRRTEQPDRVAVLERDGFRCRYCGHYPASPHVDHVVPFSRGGGIELSNLVTACKSCNSRKKDRTPDEAGMPILPLDHPVDLDEVYR